MTCVSSVLLTDSQMNPFRTRSERCTWTGCISSGPRASLRNEPNDEGSLHSTLLQDPSELSGPGIHFPTTTQVHSKATCDSELQKAGSSTHSKKSGCADLEGLSCRAAEG